MDETRDAALRHAINALVGAPYTEIVSAAEAFLVFLNGTTVETVVPDDLMKKSDCLDYLKSNIPSDGQVDLEDHLAEIRKQVEEDAKTRLIRHRVGVE